MKYTFVLCKVIDTILANLNRYFYRQVCLSMCAYVHPSQKISFVQYASVMKKITLGSHPDPWIPAGYPRGICGRLN